jgi:uncharacterized protein (TIGR02453 family)
MNSKIIFDFLNDLKLNNNRDWFYENNERYRNCKNEFEIFVDNLIPMIKEFDDEIDVFSSKECMFRIYNDIRFSKNKVPYKTNFGASISKGGRKSQFAGYYVHLEPGQSFIGGGIYMPQPDILKSIRTEVYENTEEFKKIINDKTFKKYYSEIYGEKLNSAPKDFPKDFSDIDLLKHKHYALVHNIQDSYWDSNKLLEDICIVFKIQYKFNHFLNNAILKTKQG